MSILQFIYNLSRVHKKLQFPVYFHIKASNSGRTNELVSSYVSNYLFLWEFWDIAKKKKLNGNTKMSINSENVHTKRMHSIEVDNCFYPNKSLNAQQKKNSRDVDVIG